MRDNVLFGAFLCLIASMSWGAMFPVARDAFYHIDPFYFTILRYGSVTIILVIALLLREGRSAFRFEGKLFPLWFFGTMAFTDRTSARLNSSHVPIPDVFFCLIEK